MLFIVRLIRLYLDLITQSSHKIMEHNDSLHQHHHHDLHPATGDEEALIDAAMDAADTKHEELDHDEHHHLLEPLPFEPVDEIHQDNHRRRDNHDNHQESHSPVEGDILESNKKDRSIEKPPPTSTKDPALVEEPTMWDVLSGEMRLGRQEIEFVLSDYLACSPSSLPYIIIVATRGAIHDVANIQNPITK